MLVCPQIKPVTENTAAIVIHRSFFENRRETGVALKVGSRFPTICCNRFIGCLVESFVTVETISNEYGNLGTGKTLKFYFRSERGQRDE